MHLKFNMHNMEQHGKVPNCFHFSLSYSCRFRFSRSLSLSLPSVCMQYLAFFFRAFLFCSISYRNVRDSVPNWMCASFAFTSNCFQYFQAKKRVTTLQKKRRHKLILIISALPDCTKNIQQTYACFKWNYC